MASAWTDELRQEVIDSWGKKSAGLIAASLNARGFPFSRNAVIGVAHRAGLTIPLGTPTLSKERKPRGNTPAGSLAYKTLSAIRRKKENPEQKSVPFVCRAVDIVPRNLTLMELEDGDCRFPYGDGPFVFCAHPVREGQPYCPSHCVVSFSGVPVKTHAKAPNYHPTDMAGRFNFGGHNAA